MTERTYFVQCWGWETWLGLVSLELRLVVGFTGLMYTFDFCRSGTTTGQGWMGVVDDSKSLLHIHARTHARTPLTHSHTHTHTPFFHIVTSFSILKTDAFSACWVIYLRISITPLNADVDHGIFSVRTHSGDHSLQSQPLDLCGFHTQLDTGEISGRARNVRVSGLDRA